MIVCSCNVFSDAQVQAVITGVAERPRVSRVYASLGCAAKCGRCAHTIKQMLDDATDRQALVGSQRIAA